MSLACETLGTSLRLAPRLRGRIVADDVSLRFGPKGKTFVKNVSVTIHPGQFVALVGQSGSGKSMLGALLAGLYEPSAGRIWYDGINLADFHLPSLRRQIGVCTAWPRISGASIRSSIARGDTSVPLCEIERAAKAALVHDDIMRLPRGYETSLAAAALMLSEGQRQRLALATALFDRPAILLLVGATSALGDQVEHDVFESLDRLGCTRLVVARSLDTLLRADLVLVMDKGLLVEKGDHRSLMRARGVYASLIRNHH